MKILHVINSLALGGAENLTRELIPIMNQMRGINIDILLLSDKDNVFDGQIIQEGVKIDVLKLDKIYHPMAIIGIWQHIQKGAYDLVHAHTFPTQYWVALSRPMVGKKIKYLTTEHSTHNRRREWPVFKYLDKFIYGFYDRIISVSEQTQDSLKTWVKPSKRQEKKYVVIENGVNIEKIRQVLPYEKEDLIKGIPNGTTLLCMPGRFSQAKDQATVIRAIKRLPENVHLLLVGEGDLIGDHKACVNQLGLGDRIHFLGFRQDIYRILKTVDLVVLSSHWEGFGMAAVEGMASGKPIVASRVPGLSEVVEGAGFLFDPQNDEALAQCIQHLLGDEETYKEKARQGQIRAEEYDIHIMAKRMKDLYDAI